MITDYKNKQQSPERAKQQKFASLSPAIQDAIKARYREHEAAAFKLGVKPMGWRFWLNKEGY